MDLGGQAERVKFMIRDRGSNFTAAFDAVLANAGIRTVLCNVRTPRMNAIAERWIGGCRGELLDRTLVWNRPSCCAMPGGRRRGPCPPIVEHQSSPSARNQPDDDRHDSRQPGLDVPVSGPDIKTPSPSSCRATPQAPRSPQTEILDERTGLPDTPYAVKGVGRVW